MDSIYATIEFSLEDRPHTYMLYWYTAVDDWNNYGNNNNSRDEDKTGED